MDQRLLNESPGRGDFFDVVRNSKWVHSSLQCGRLFQMDGAADWKAQESNADRGILSILAVTECRDVAGNDIGMMKIEIKADCNSNESTIFRHFPAAFVLLL